jgi:hypothetical protein
VVLMAGGGTSMMVFEADLVPSALEAALIVVAAAVTLAGAVNVTEVKVKSLSAPAPDCDHATPLPPLSLVTVAVKAAVCPWSTVCAVLGEILTLIVPPPPPPPVDPVHSNIHTGPQETAGTPSATQAAPWNGTIGLACSVVALLQRGVHSTG